MVDWRVSITGIAWLVRVSRSTYLRRRDWLLLLRLLLLLLRWLLARWRLLRKRARLARHDAAKNIGT